MRYLSSDLIYRTPVNWIETDKTESEILSKVKIDNYVHDSDSCGEEVYYVAFSTGKAFRIYHSWDLDFDSEFFIDNSYDITEIPMKDAMIHLNADRDWLVT